MSNDSEQAPPLPPRLQLPLFAQSRRQQQKQSSLLSSQSNRLATKSELDVVPPPPLTTSSMPERRKQQQQQQQQMLLRINQATMRSHSNNSLCTSTITNGFASTSPSSSSNNTAVTASRPISINGCLDVRNTQSISIGTSSFAFSNQYYGINCNYFSNNTFTSSNQNPNHSSTGNSPVCTLPPLVHSLSFPNFTSLPANQCIQPAFEHQSSVHRSSIGAPFTGPSSHVQEMLAKVQRVASEKKQANETRHSLQPKRQNGDLIDLDIEQDSGSSAQQSPDDERDVLQLFDPLTGLEPPAKRTPLAERALNSSVSRRDSTESAPGDLNLENKLTRLNVLQQTTEDDLQLSKIKLPRPSEYTTSTFYQSLKFKPANASSTATTTSGSSNNSKANAYHSVSTTSATQSSMSVPSSASATVNNTTANSVHIPDNKLHIHTRPEGLTFAHLSNFTEKLRTLRLKHLHDDENTNPGFVISGRLDTQSDATSQASITLSIYTPFDADPICFNCALITSVQHVICGAIFKAPSNSGSSDVSFDGYALQVNGTDEYLHPQDGLLGEFTYIQRCFKRNKSAFLRLVDTRNHANYRRYARTAEDDQQIQQLSTIDLYSKSLLNRHAEVDYYSISVVLDILDGECARLFKLGSLTDTNDQLLGFSSNGDQLHIAKDGGSTSTHALLKPIYQAVKAICNMLGNLETILLNEKLENMSQLYLICVHYRLNSKDEKLNATIENVLPEVIGSAVCELKRAIYEMLNLYSNAYPVGFTCTTKPMTKDDWELFVDAKLAHAAGISVIESRPVTMTQLANGCDEEEEPICSQAIQDTLLCQLDTLCALNCQWIADYQCFYVQCELVYGLRSLVIRRSDRVPIQLGLFPRLEFGQFIQFDAPIICDLPRETRLICTLFGVKLASQASSSAASASDRLDLDEPTLSNSTSPNEQHVPLAITCLPLFDDQLSLQQGSRLLGMWPKKYADPTHIPMLNSPCPDRGSPLLTVRIIGGHRSIYFPSFGQLPTDWNLWIGDTKAQDATFDLLSASTAIDNQPENIYESSIAQRQLDQLDPTTQDQIYGLLTRDPLKPLCKDEQRALWERRHSLVAVPSALAQVLSSVTSWAPSRLKELYQLICAWRELQPMDALQLLLPDYADIFVRALAVRSLARLSDDELLDLLPQLVYALRFERSADCALGWLLQLRSLRSVRLAHALYWILKDSVSDESSNGHVDQRLELHLNALLALAGNAFRLLTRAQHELLKQLDMICERLRSHKSNRTLIEDLQVVQNFLEQQSICLPLNIGCLVRRLQLSACTYFHSNSLPIKLVFVTASDDDRPSVFNKSLQLDSVADTRRKSEQLASPIFGPTTTCHALYKIGDDLRQDALTMQMLGIMDKLWMKEGLDMKLVTFSCVPTGPKRGLIQMIKQAETLRRIQNELGLVTGSFNNAAIHSWLKKHNPSSMQFNQAVLNFTYSCAGYAVATYVLGIGDRHNDNIMLTPNGHLFHIDFGKFLGDVQMIGSIRRDRVPFILTSDMAYVINDGGRATLRFQKFIDICCQAYNTLRHHCGLFLSLFSLMLGAGISGVTPTAIRYVHNALRPSLTDSKACETFNRLIIEALSSKSTQFNFFIHNLAQMRFSSELDDDRRLSFAPCLILAHEAPSKLSSVEALQVKRGILSGQKQYFYVLRVERLRPPLEQYLLRTYKEHFELRQKLLAVFRLANLPPLARSKASSSAFNKNNLNAIKAFWESLQTMTEEIWHSDLVYTFLNPLERDQPVLEDGNIEDDETSIYGSITTISDLDRFEDFKGNFQLDAMWDDQSRQNRRTLNRNTSGKTGEIKLSLCYKKESLMIMIMHARNLLSSRYSSPDTYVKTYLLPDPNKLSKRKTRICMSNAHPTFMEMIVYEMSLEQLRHRLLEVSVWDYEGIGENLLIGSISIPLHQLLEHDETVSWYPLKYEDRRQRDRR